MKRIGTLGYIILGLITTSAFANTTSAPATAPAADSVQAASGKHKKGGKKPSHHAHKKKQAPAAEQK